jgi:hypothetical protein
MAMVKHPNAQAQLTEVYKKTTSVAESTEPKMYAR